MRRAKIVLLLVGIALAACAEDAPPRVRTDVGVVEGVGAYRGVQAFLGIPYAEPPTGTGRWRPPVPVAAWSGVRDAKAFSLQCPQIPDPIESASLLPQGEDCLTLNVFTPSADAGRRAVMVFVHGGAWVSGGSGDPWYDGAAIARRGDVVVVTLNYRLGSLGFSDLSAIGGPQYAASGVAGLLDQVEALRWVQRNVARFGGDPANVTLFGHSAGGMSVSALLSSTVADGLFQRAIVMSGAANLFRSPTVARGITDEWMAQAGVTDLAGLQALSVDALMAAQEAVLAQAVARDLVYSPVLDGTVLSANPLADIAAGSAAGIPVLLGWTNTETRYWLLYNEAFMYVQPDFLFDLFPWLGDAVAARRATLVAGYETRRGALEDWEVTMRIATDAFFRVPTIRLADALAPHGPVHAYRFRWQTPVDGYLYQSPHAVELPFVFGTIDAATDFVGEDAPTSMRDDTMDAFVAFAKTGDPGHRGLPSWLAYDPSTRATMDLDLTSSVVLDPDAADRAEWDGIPFDSVTPAVDPLRGFE